MWIPRFRLRTMMLGVGIAGVIGGAWAVLERRRERFERLGWHHRQQVVSILFGSPGPGGRYIYVPTDHGQRGEVVSERQQ